MWGERGGELMEKIGYKPPVQHLTKSGVGVGGNQTEQSIR